MPPKKITGEKYPATRSKAHKSKTTRTTSRVNPPGNGWLPNHMAYSANIQMKLAGTPSTLTVAASRKKAKLLNGYIEEELGDEVVLWREETGNGYPESLPDKERLVRAMNTFSLVNEQGKLCHPNIASFTKHDQPIHIVGWVTTLAVGPKRFFRVVTGWWPPKEWNPIDNEASVWRVSMLAMRVRVADIHWGSAKIFGYTIQGLFARAWNGDVEYWLHHPSDEYKPLFEKLCTEQGWEMPTFQDLDPSEPNDGKMHPWVLKMLRMEHNIMPVDPRDKPFEYEGECGSDHEYLTDACSISTDDDAEFPTGRNWRAHVYHPTEDVEMTSGSNSTASEGVNEDAVDKDGPQPETNGGKGKSATRITGANAAGDDLDDSRDDQSGGGAGNPRSGSDKNQNESALSQWQRLLEPPTLPVSSTTSLEPVPLKSTASGQAENALIPMLAVASPSPHNLTAPGAEGNLVGHTPASPPSAAGAHVPPATSSIPPLVAEAINVPSASPPSPIRDPSVDRRPRTPPRRNQALLDSF